MSNQNKKGSIGVQSENIFPIIKKFLYSDHDIFLRELVSNAVDATQKLKTLVSKGESKASTDDLSVTVRIEDDKLIISDRGIGMSAEEIDKYINQIAISGAEEFLDKYKDDAASIIGHFGLGFYSAFMVAKRVEIYTQSYRDSEPSIRWSCEGNPEFSMEEAEKRERGTDIILYIDEESKEFLEPEKIQSLLQKYCLFLPVPIIFGKKQEWKDGKMIDTDEDQIINNTEPAWTKKPVDLKDEDYQKFYKELYPMSEEPLFWIHLNIDYPFNLTGILYFPRIKNNMDISRHKVQLYSNQVFVTDSVEGILPDFLTILHGVLDSPDIPLNVSRSYLQSDANVKKISAYITRKVADKLNELFKDERATYEEKWSALELFVKYGMLTDEKFYEKAEKFALLRNTEDKLYTFEEYRNLISGTQTDKDGKVVCLYAVDKEAQYSYIKGATDKGYDVLLTNGQLDMPFISMLEQKQQGTRYVRVDSDTLENLIPKNEENKDKANVSEEEKEIVCALFEQQLPELSKAHLHISASHQGFDQKPIVVVQNEFMRRMKDMSSFQQGMGFGDFPDSYEINLNLDSALIRGIVEVFVSSDNQEYKALSADKKGYDARLDVLYSQSNSGDLDDAAKETNKKDIEETTKQISEIKDKLNGVYKNFGNENKVISQLIDLALLSKGMLTGASLDSFINRSLEIISDKK
ncbi:molecular chaperone HtpG [Porphyromonas cangingivalis]|uniref:Chaperone protein HtpG n=1 Tax=Porphyromonas cangingivalis TaxID=36874 RepID=A0A1T4KBM7_PORCN|nr:molecular chaperone HtpG [Porphyromonas cangingivalis]SJZ39844.1 molecular chaperone HtpG [Porphyromonas cangingivalis]VEJ02839.1 High temperature protein G [Porphyromonas cangingivalis]